MRREQLFHQDWFFTKEAVDPLSNAPAGAAVTLPHTWNAQDGQDGGNDYYRGTCWYTKVFSLPPLCPGEEAWLEFSAAAMTAEVYLNGVMLARHEGGYSTFRVNLSPALREKNFLAVSVDNGKNRTVYPQKADFTFYGGIYREVKLLIVPAAHFALDYYGGRGVKVTPVLSDDLCKAEIAAEAWVTDAAKEVTFTIGDISFTVPAEGGKAQCVLPLENVHLWNGREDPFLYTLRAEIPGCDLVEIPFGCRTIDFDPNCGFILNGKPLRLCGAARHQDWQGIGPALSPAEHQRDMELIAEMGANTIRLAHYQHSQYFYDLCDRYGMIVWAEIPYITEHMSEGRANTISQMTELIVQNHHHPSIVCWGLSNEITASGGVTEDMVDNHRQLKELCHRMDPSRPTTMAHAFMLNMRDPFVLFPDVRGYNLYFGWYLAETAYNDQWFDDFRALYPDAVIGLSEYGADANPAYQSSAPERGDWTESYQAVYHEHMLQMWSERPYIWAMHCWNMFDFGADGRNEIGKPGQNQKGLVTFDRKIKKDAYFIYKAYLSQEPFLHLCGSRYVDRAEAVTEIKVYSNQPSVTLFVDGKEFAVQNGSKVFRFSVPITGEHLIEARCGKLSDRSIVRRVQTPNPDYVQPGNDMANWFDRPDALVREGYYSVMDPLTEIKRSAQGRQLIEEFLAKNKSSNGEVSENITMPEEYQREIDKMTAQQMIRQLGKTVTPEMARELNNQLNRIPRVPVQ